MILSESDLYNIPLHKYFGRVLSIRLPPEHLGTYFDVILRTNCCGLKALIPLDFKDNPRLHLTKWEAGVFVPIIEVPANFLFYSTRYLKSSTEFCVTSTEVYEEEDEDYTDHEYHEGDLLRKGFKIRHRFVNHNTDNTCYIWSKSPLKFINGEKDLSEEAA